MTATITRAEALRRLVDLEAPIGRVREALDKARRQHERTPAWVYREVDRIEAEQREIRGVVDALEADEAVAS